VPRRPHRRRSAPAIPAVHSAREVAAAEHPRPDLAGKAVRAVRTPMPGHDVSGTDRQTLGRAMQSTTTMMPLRQCGHFRNDCPVRCVRPLKPHLAGRVHSIGAAPCGAFHGENPVTDNRWELAVVTLVAVAVFFLVWHLVAPLIG
jgi:hypothetical protein